MKYKNSLDIFRYQKEQEDASGDEYTATKDDELPELVVRPKTSDEFAGEITEESFEAEAPEGTENQAPQPAPHPPKQAATEPAPPVEDVKEDQAEAYDEDDEDDNDEDVPHKIEVEVMDASLARKKTEDTRRFNSMAAVRKEATEILKKVNDNMKYAIAEEKYHCDLFGPSRAQVLEQHPPKKLVLRNNLKEYHPETMEAVMQHLELAGYKTEIVDNIIFRIKWD